MLNIKFLVSLILAVILSGCFPNNNDVTIKDTLITGRTMGTTYNIKVVVDPSLTDVAKLKADIDQALVEVNQSMSTYIPDSELSLLNKNVTSEPILLSDQLNTVLVEAKRLGDLSAGKLDVTVGPLVNLWGFGPNYQVEYSPSAEQIEQANEQVGIEYISIVEQQLTKQKPSAYIDLSTIAKGFGVDVVADLISAQGIENYLVEIGGEMRVKGFKANGTLWHIAIEKPVSEERSVHQVIVPKDNAVATSGDYRNYHEVNGQRLSHIIDPDTAKPINHKLVSVTVIHPSAMTADGLSTALMVMGEEKALTFAEQHDIAAYMIFKSENGFVEQSTVKFMQFMK